MNRLSRRRTLLAWLGSAGLPLAGRAQKAYGPGVTDSEIRIGQTMPLSGPLSMLSHLSKAAQGWFDKVNAEGGIRGRKVKLITLDDGYSPPRTVEQTRRLVEQDEVLAIFQNVGTPTNSAIHGYLNKRGVPHLLIMSGANKWNDPKGHPWTLSGMPSYDTEARIWARWILANKPDAKIAVLAQNDDFGRDYLAGLKAGLKAGLGDRAKTLIVAEATYEATDATVDSQLIQLKASGANVFANLSNGKFTVQSLRKAAELGWKPQTFLPIGSSSIGSILRPAGIENAVGAIAIAYNKNPADPQWAEDAGMREYLAFAAKHLPGIDIHDSLVIGGYGAARLLHQILLQCGDNLTRENVMKQAASLKDFVVPTMLPGITVTTSASDYELYSQLRLQRFDGKSWVLFGELVSR